MKNILSALFASVLVLSSASFAANTNPTSALVPVPKPAAEAAKVAVQQDMININTADAQTLVNLKGVGPKKADAIIAWRKANGGFKTIEQFTEVKGIGAATLEKNRKNIRL